MRLISKTSPLVVATLSLIAGIYDVASANSSRNAWSRYSTNQVASSVTERSGSLQAQSMPFPPFLNERRNIEGDVQDCFNEDSRRDREECFKDLRRDQFDSRELREADLQDCFEGDRDHRQDCLEDLRDDRHNHWNRSRPGFNSISPPRPLLRN